MDRRATAAPEEGIDAEDCALLFLLAFVACGRLHAQTLSPVSKEFLLAAETVVGDADAIDERASNSVYSFQMQEARSAYGALGGPAATDIERQIVAESGQMLFITDTSILRHGISAAISLSVCLMP